MSEAIDKPLGWDEEVTKPNEGGGDFTLLPHGCVFPYKVEKMDKLWFAGSANLSACNMAELTFTIGDARAGHTNVKDKLKLNKKLEFLLCAFFTSIGQRKSGEPLKMDWAKVLNSFGFCEVGIREYKNKEGKTRRINEISKYLSPEDGQRIYDMQCAQPLPVIPPLPQDTTSTTAHANGGTKPWEAQEPEQEPIPF